MVWAIDGNFLKGPGLGDSRLSLTHDGASFQIQENIPITPAGMGSLAKITISQAIKLSKSDEDKVIMTISAGTKLKLVITPVIPLLPGKNNFSVEWAFSEKPIVMSYTWNEEASLPLPDEKALADFLFEKVGDLWTPEEALTTDLLKRRVVDLGNAIGLDLLTFTLGKPIWENAKFTFPDAMASLMIGTEKLEFSVDTLTLDPHIPTLSTGDQKISLKLKNDQFLGGDSLKLKLHLGSTFVITPAATQSTIELNGPGGQPALSAYLPGSATGDGSPENNVFVFEATTMIFDAGGLRGDLQCRPTSLFLGDDNAKLTVQISEGQLSFNGGHYTARVQASARLPFWEGAEGSLLVMASSIPSARGFLATWEMRPVAVWRDPSGYIEVHHPHATVDIGFENKKWKIGGSVGGELRLVNGAKLLGDAGDWLEEFLKDFRMEFQNLSLLKLASLGNNDNNGTPASVEIQPVGQPAALRLWKLFDFKLTSFVLSSDKSFGFGGKLGFEVGGARFEGNLPRLRVKCSSGLRISRDSGDALSISGRLRTQGGVEVQLDLSQVEDEQVSELQGAGSLVLPGFPTLGITCALGRRKDDNAPIVMLFLEADYPITLYPGVVMRRLGLGFGVNKVLKGVDGKSPEELVPSLISNPAGLPNPALHSGWEVPKYKEGMETDVSFAAQSYLAPSPRGEGPFPYVGRVTLFVRPTNETLIMLATNLWLFTSLTDAATEDFQRAPALKGVAVIFPRHGYLEMMVRTERKPRMSQPLPMLQKAFEIGSGEFYLKASRDIFVYRAGPLRVETELEGIRFKGSMLYAIHVNGDQAVALSQVMLEAHTEKSCSVGFQLGPLQVTAGFRCTFDLEVNALAAGIVHHELGPLLYGRARIMVEFAIAAWVELNFHLTLKFWRIRVTIAWSKRFQAELRLGAEIDLELAISKQPALYGRVQLQISLFGYTFSPVVQVGEQNAKHLVEGREITKNIISPKSLPATI